MTMQAGGRAGARWLTSCKESGEGPGEEEQRVWTEVQPEGRGGDHFATRTSRVLRTYLTYLTYARHVPYVCTELCVVGSTSGRLGGVSPPGAGGPPGAHSLELSPREVPRPRLGFDELTVGAQDVGVGKRGVGCRAFGTVCVRSLI